MVVEVEVQQILIIDLSNLDDGFIVQMLLQGCDFAGHQLVGSVLFLASVAQQVVGGCNLAAGHARAGVRVSLGGGGMGGFGGEGARGKCKGTRDSGTTCMEEPSWGTGRGCRGGGGEVGCGDWEWGSTMTPCPPPFLVKALKSHQIETLVTAVIMDDTAACLIQVEGEKCDICNVCGP